MPDEKGRAHCDRLPYDRPVDLRKPQKKERQKDETKDDIGKVEGLPHDDSIAEGALDRDRPERVDDSGGEREK